KDLRIEDMRFDGLIPALNSGKIDIILSSMTRTKQRARSIDFSDGYVTNGLCMLVAKDSTVKTAADLNSDQRKIAVKRGTTGHVYAVENLKMAGLTVLDAAETCVTEVIQKKADAFIYDQISIYQHWKKHPDSTQAILDPIRKETWAIGIKKEQPELLASINGFLRKFKEADGFKALGEKYMAEEKKTFESLGVPFIFH
ncbi:MAG: transporter substrate-binding domain-containing protein, partial [Verrucomicrobiota bacterium]